MLRLPAAQLLRRAAQLLPTASQGLLHTSAEAHTPVAKAAEPAAKPALLKVRCGSPARAARHQAASHEGKQQPPVPLRAPAAAQLSLLLAPRNRWPHACAPCLLLRRRRCLQEFQIYRWNPDEPEKPKYVSYKVDINRCEQRAAAACADWHGSSSSSSSMRRHVSSRRMHGSSSVAASSQLQQACFPL